MKISKTEYVHHSQNVSNLYHIKGIYIAFQYLGEGEGEGGGKTRVQDYWKTGGGLARNPVLLLYCP